MTTQVVTVMQLDTVGLALEAVRRQAEDLQDVGEIFVIDTARRLVGRLTFKHLVVNAAGRLVREVMDPAPMSVPSGGGPGRCCAVDGTLRLVCLARP